MLTRVVLGSTFLGLLVFCLTLRTHPAIGGWDPAPDAFSAGLVIPICVIIGVFGQRPTDPSRDCLALPLWLAKRWGGTCEQSRVSSYRKDEPWKDAPTT
jgi:hypothetical protein